MQSDLRSLLKSFRDTARSEREKGNYFERLAVAFIKNDPGMAQEYEDAWLFSDWAKQTGRDGRDTGIDVVAKLRGEDGFCAIQCKFYREGHRIQKADIDSFFTASGKHPFTRRLIIDTTDAPWSGHAEDALDGQQIETTRIGLDRLELSPIDWAEFLLKDHLVVGEKKKPRPHQTDALEAVRDGFAGGDRGKLIMACGTGKTFTALKIAEALVGAGKSVLFLVPSLSLMSQTIREWTIDSETPLRAFAVCSDVQVGKRRKSTDDMAEIEVHDLDYPATTNAAKLAAKVAHAAPDRMTAVFATYQSIQVVAAAQAEHGLPEFDLIICDEAHRTTGAKFPGEDDSNFVKVHDQSFIKGAKRLYMTATPRVFGDGVKTKANEASVELCSMDDEALYGPTFFQRGFGWAVENGLLTDYKVIVLAVDEGMVNGRFVNGVFAIFTAKPGTVTVDNSPGAISVSGLQFASDGYKIGGGAIGLDAGDAIVRVGDGTSEGAAFKATIASELTGPGQLHKTDLGMLILTGANSYTGGTRISSGALQLGDGGTAGSILGGVQNDGRLAFNRADDLAFDDVISGGGVIAQIGSGVTTLSGDSWAFGGRTEVRKGTLAVGGKLGGAVEVFDGGLLTGRGQVGSLLNQAGGIVAPGGFGTLTVVGGYEGRGGTLRIDAVLGGDDSETDRLLVRGAASGSTLVEVANRGGLGAQTSNGILVVDVEGASSGVFTLAKGDFRLGGENALTAGAYAYVLRQDVQGGDWKLRSSVGGEVGPPAPADPSRPAGDPGPPVDPAQPQMTLYQPGVPIYEAYPQVLQTMNGLTTMRQRIGARQSGTERAGVWGRVEGRHLKAEPAVSTSQAELKTDYWKVQFGIDHILADGLAGGRAVGWRAHRALRRGRERRRFAPWGRSCGRRRLWRRRDPHLDGRVGRLCRRPGPGELVRDRLAIQHPWRSRRGRRCERLRLLHRGRPAHRRGGRLQADPAGPTHLCEGRIRHLRGSAWRARFRRSRRQPSWPPGTFVRPRLGGDEHRRAGQNLRPRQSDPRVSGRIARGRFRSADLKSGRTHLGRPRRGGELCLGRRSLPDLRRGLDRNVAIAFWR